VWTSPELTTIRMRGPAVGVFEGKISWPPISDALEKDEPDDYVDEEYFHSEIA